MVVIEGSGSPAKADLSAIQADVTVPAEDSAEVANHVHSYERWFAKANVPSGMTHVADRIGTSVTSFQIDGGAGAGTGSWGSWVQVLGSTDTPATAGKVKFDFHKVLFTAAERNNTVYIIQFAYGASGAAGLAAGEYAEVIYRPATGVNREASVLFQTKRWPAGTLVWARCWAVGADTGTLDFLLGLHEYDA